MATAKDNNTITKAENPEILLARDMEKNTIAAVTGIGKKGKLKTTAPSQKNRPQFMRIDRNGDAFSNFFSNFLSQLRNPTRFAFFIVKSEEAQEKANELQKLAERSKLEPQMLSIHEALKPENTHNQQIVNTMETTAQKPEAEEYRFTPEQIDWQTMNSMGLSRERLEKMNLLEPLLKGYKTNELVNVVVNLGTAVTRTDARLSLQPGEEGMAVVAVHGIRREPNLNFEFFGHKFTEEDKKNLQSSGNMGRVVDLTNSKTGEAIPSVISIDRLTNEIIALKSEYIRIPDQIKGVTLDDLQKQTLQEGKPLYLEGMISKKGEPFDATLQFNADKRYVEFLFDRNQAQANRQAAVQTQSQGQPGEAPKTFRGKELDQEQYAKFKDGQTVYVSGLTDRKGKEYQGYITFDKETGKTAFEFPNTVKEQAKPAEESKTQAAVNSEGKTNEATKKLKEPLDSKQQAPKDEKQKEQQEKQEAPAKSKGRKI